MKRHVFWLIFWSILLSGCGTRKSAISKFKEVSEVEQGVKVSENSESKTAETIEQKNDVKEENETVVTIKEYAVNADGSTYLIKETSKKHKGSRTDNSTSNSTKQNEIKQEKQSKTDIKAKSKLSVKDKAVEADKTTATNAGGAGWLYLFILSPILLYLIYLFFKKR